MRNWGVLLCGLSLLLWITAEPTPAQEVNAQMRGVVTDPTGATVSDATVQAINSGTAVSTLVSTAADGSFRFLQLPVGIYDLTVTKDGFAGFTEHGIQLALNQVFSLSVQLQVGQVNASTEVVADPVQVETASSQMGTVVDAHKIVDLPLNGRNWTTLQQLVPGVVAQSDRNPTYATNGSESQQNSYLIDGADSVDLELNRPSIIPSPDAIQEFNLIDSTINPEYSRNSGGILNAILKSGGNQVHGSMFEFYRDTFLNSRNLYQQSGPIYHQNQFGGTIGGPIRKDHTFFFLSYQGSRFRQPESGGGQTTVFTAAQRNGVFPDLATSTARSPIPLVGESGLSYPAGTPYSQIFPTGHIPTRDFNSISQNLLANVPLPNAPGGLYSFNPLVTGQQDQGIARLDHTFTEKDALWATAFIEHSPNTSTLPSFGATLPGYAQADTSAFKQFTADWTHTFNATTLNELRASYLRYNYAAVYPLNPTLPSSVGFTGITPQYAAGASIPLVTVSGFFNLGFSPAGPQPRIDRELSTDRQLV